jgi:hypothetical protein
VSIPFGNVPLLSLFCYKADGSAVDQLLDKKLKEIPLPTPLFLETKTILSRVSSPLGSQTSSLPNKITPEKFAALYKLLNEATSSSPSG